MTARLSDESGVLVMPLGLALVFLGLMALGTLGLMRNWRKLTEVQLRLDRCVGKVAMELRNEQNSIESANRRMEMLRVAIPPAAIYPAVAAALQRALELQALLEEVTLRRWQARRIAWMLERGCDHSRDFPRPLPAMPWIHDPPDPVGARPLRWPPDARLEFRIQLNHSPRHAAAVRNTCSSAGYSVGSRRGR